MSVPLGEIGQLETNIDAFLSVAPIVPTNWKEAVRVVEDIEMRVDTSRFSTPHPDEVLGEYDIIARSVVLTRTIGEQSDELDFSIQLPVDRESGEPRLTRSFEVGGEGDRMPPDLDVYTAAGMRTLAGWLQEPPIAPLTVKDVAMLNRYMVKPEGTDPFIEYVQGRLNGEDADPDSPECKELLHLIDQTVGHGAEFAEQERNKPVDEDSLLMVSRQIRKPMGSGIYAARTIGPTATEWSIMLCATEDGLAPAPGRAALLTLSKHTQGEIEYDSPDGIRYAAESTGDDRFEHNAR